MNVYNDQTSRHPRQRGWGGWSFYIPFVRFSFDDCSLLWGCDFLFFNKTFLRSSDARHETEEFTYVTEDHSK